jgi:DNA-binding MarR family transcriptional regulator
MNKQGNFYQAPNRIYELDISASSKLVLTYLYRCRNTQTGLCIPSYKNIALNCSIERSTAIDCIKELLDKKYIEVTRAFNTVNSYTLVVNPTVT